jgi:hypothetical protein
MRSPRWSLLVLLASCEAHISDGGAGDAATGDAVADAAADSVAFGPWSPPQAKWFMPCGEDHYVMVSGTGETDLVEGKLGGGAPMPIAAVNTDDTETGAFVTGDCLTLYFASTRTSPERIYSTRRDAVGAAWQPPTVMMDFDALDGDHEDPWLSADGRTFAFTRESDIYISTR